jgi:hypothetical protein
MHWPFRILAAAAGMLLLPLVSRLAASLGRGAGRADAK